MSEEFEVLLTERRYVSGVVERSTCMRTSELIFVVMQDLTALIGQSK